MEIFRLFGSIFIENEKANKSLRDTEKQATDVGKTLQETTKAAIKFGDELGQRLTAVGSKMTKVAGVPLVALKAAMLGLAKTTADYGDRVAKASQEIGLSVDAYQELEYALGQNGVATEQFEMAIGNVLTLSSNSSFDTQFRLIFGAYGKKSAQCFSSILFCFSLF